MIYLYGFGKIFPKTYKKTLMYTNFMNYYRDVFAFWDVKFLNVGNIIRVIKQVSITSEVKLKII